MVTLTETEARVLYTALNGMWAPRCGYVEFGSAAKKLCQIGGGYCCRDCTGLGTRPSRYGGWLCATHKDEEDARFTSQETK